ncbi:hypothetical protein CEUSTIGMA_g9934.t1 [Chlamydomonas eustigma]|uniref:ER membrane protein complex subunit 7 beta-sandwich domain-containing protein n=1 Tax=Chlamydomonas eustigma TaxID=1157962 RepID=A0A250XHF6_9CHLO|nr:hypothetical protein CEUSTIGMA_g9934.t1 [Chlamydomonas eustigma]|eukprot:GAX82507.1 hypothetical protein CEUSTIGMA_g9934.t1 [Chlamydomonas eustigma]
METFKKFAALCILLCFRSTSASTVSGVVVTPNGKGAVHAVVHLFASDGQYITAYCDNDGSFTLRGVPAGSHLLQAHLMGYYFPEVRVDTLAKGMVSAFFVIPNTKQVQPLQEPLLIRPIGELQYFEKRSPVDIWSFVKSPMGIIIIFSVVVMFILPNMKVDPEDYKEMQQQLRGGEVPSSAESSGRQQQPARIQGGR